MGINFEDIKESPLYKIALRQLDENYKGENLPDISDVDAPTIKSLTHSFKTAIERHLSNPSGSEERIKSSANARRVVGEHIGYDEKTNQVKPLLASNTKLHKAGRHEDLKLPSGIGIQTTGLSLSPAFQHGKFNTCPNSASCKTECLGKTSGGFFLYGGGKDLSMMKGPRLAALKRTTAMIKHPEEFAIRLHDEINTHKIIAQNEGYKLGVRLNVLSDLHPKIMEPIIKAHPDVQFYDYTKNNVEPIAPNHHLTYSSTGVSQPKSLTGLDHDIENKNSNWKLMRKKLDQGHNVAMAFSNKTTLPKKVHDVETGKEYHVINGDEHDYRPLDGQHESGSGYIVGLTRKSAVHSDANAASNSKGFFVHYDPKHMKKNGKLIRDTEGNPIPTNHVVHIAPQTTKISIYNNDMEKQQ